MEIRAEFILLIAVILCFIGYLVLRSKKRGSFLQNKLERDKRLDRIENMLEEKIKDNDQTIVVQQPVYWTGRLPYRRWEGRRR